MNLIMLGPYNPIICVLGPLGLGSRVPTGQLHARADIPSSGAKLSKARIWMFHNISGYGESCVGNIRLIPNP